MADVFSHSNALNLLKNKYVCFIGDSNIRAQYKDLICLLTANALANHTDLRVKCENSFKGDSLIRGSKIVRGRDYEEAREFFHEENDTTLDFMFITRVYNQDLEDLFQDFKNHNKAVPDVIVVSSSIWDLNRWGPNGVSKYKENLVKLMRLMKKSLPPRCLVIWAAALPPSRQIASSFFIKQIAFMQPMMRFEILEANWFARTTVAAHGYDILDCHFYMRMQIHRRAKDGLHYLPIPVRYITNLLLTHIALSWGVTLPGNVDSLLLQKAINLDRERELVEFGKDKTTKQSLQKNKQISDRLNKQVPSVCSSRGLQITISTQDDEESGRQCNLLRENWEYAANPQWYLDNTEQDEVPTLPNYWSLPVLPSEPGPERNRNKRKSSRREKRTRAPEYKRLRQDRKWPRR